MLCWYNDKSDARFRCVLDDNRAGRLSSAVELINDSFSISRVPAEDCGRFIFGHGRYNRFSIYLTLPTPRVRRSHTVAMVEFSWMAEYAAFVVMLSLSMVIGLYFGCVEGKQNTVSEYLLGGKQMSVFPITMSLIARLVPDTNIKIPAGNGVRKLSSAASPIVIFLKIPALGTTPSPSLHSSQYFL